MNSRMDQFRAFVEKHPTLKEEVRNKKTTWQNVYEEWYLYGENNDSWKQYEQISQPKSQEASTEKTSSSIVNMDSIKSIMGYVQKLNPDSVNKTLNTAQKVIQIVQSINGGGKIPTLPGVTNSMYSDWWDQMRDDILKKLYENEKYLEYLRYHPKWYYYLDMNPAHFNEFEKIVKKELKITTYDRLESAKKQINFASAMLNYFNKQ